MMGCWYLLLNLVKFELEEILIFLHKLTSFHQIGHDNSLEVNYEEISSTSSHIEIGIIKQFTFSSTLARMSVVARSENFLSLFQTKFLLFRNHFRSLTDNHFVVYVKGAPERIEELCIPNSIPEDFSEVLRAYTLRGFRVIALAHRRLPSEVNIVRLGKMKRDQIEQNLVCCSIFIL